MARINATLRYNFRVVMSIKVTYKDGVFEPLEDVKGARPGQRYTVFSDEELDEIRETLGWLKAAEKSFEFWNNPADAVYDTL
jgi:predicted DNA-binding antitoxin AbrB/MazE fold protein